MNECKAITNDWNCDAIHMLTPLPVSTFRQFSTLEFVYPTLHKITAYGLEDCSFPKNFMEQLLLQSRKL